MATKTPPKKSQQKIPRPQKPGKTAPAQPPVIASPQGGRASFPIVGIGASAGGLEALEDLFNPMPPDSGMGFVIVQDLDPTHASNLANLLKKFTPMPVIQVEDPMPVQPNCIYVTPPNSDMELLDSVLRLAKPTMSRGLRLPIDHFFRSLAADQAEKAIGIILSGTGTDGTMGLKAIKEVGGLAIVQAPESARYDGMPLSAINTGLVDMVLPPDKIAAQLMAYVGHSFEAESRQIWPGMPGIREQLQKIFFLLKNHTGHDFSGYKENTLVRRIERRMMISQIAKVEDYQAYLEHTPAEVETLFRELLIGVTGFFRDPEAFEYLEQKVIVPLFTEQRETPRQVRIWVPGCSTGEEAYSVAILLHEQMERSGQPVEIQVFATDVDQAAIIKAREGRYPDSIAADVTPDRLERFFFRENDSNTYQVKREIRDRVVFAVQSVIKDPPFSRLDLICCRNLMIYLGPELQQKLLALFHYALNPGGYLFLGNSETLGNSQKLFRTLDQKWKIFKRADFVTHLKTTFEFSDQTRQDVKRMRASQEKPISARELTEQLLLAEYAPTSVLINEKGEMLYIHGHTGKFLEQSTGEASTNILQIAREGLRMPLSTAIRNANAQRKPQAAEGISVKTDAGMIRVNLTVAPVLKPAAGQGLMLVTFSEIPAPRPSGDKGKSGRGDDWPAQHIWELEQELRSTREYLQTVIEELETTNEELKSANEELQSSNEELQSTVEELQTSKEELQSVNEELVTVNTELQDKVEELTLANNDIKNLLENTQLGIIFLDTNLRIRRFTHAFRQIVDLIPEDIGRPLEQFVLKLRYEQLIPDAQQVLESQASREIEVQAEDGRWYLLQIMPYRTMDDQIAGVVLTLAEVTQIKQAEKALVDSLNQYRLLVEASHDGIVHNDIAGHIISINSNFAQLFGFDSANEILESGITTFDLLAPEARDTAMERAAPVFESDHIRGVEMKVMKRDGTPFEVEFSTTLIRDDLGAPKALVTFVRDITERKQAEETLRQSEARERARANELATLLDAVPDIVWIAHDPEGKVITGNRAAANFLRMQPDANLSKTAPPDERPPHFTVWKDGREIPPNELPVQLAARGIMVTDFEEEVVFDDGIRNYLIGNASPLYDEQGQVRGAVAAFRDITERLQAEVALRQSEENLRITLNSIGDAVIATDTNGRIVRMNPVAENLSGWSQAEALGKPFSQIFPLVQAENWETIPGLVEAVLQAGHVVELAKDTILIDKEGQEYYVGDSGAPIQNAQGEISGVVLVLRDVTQQLKTEQELLKARKLESVGLLAGGIAHDFNNLLTTLFGNIELAQLALPPTHESYHHLEATRYAMENARSLTKQLLTFAKGGAPLKEIQDISHMLVETVNFAMHGSKSKVEITIAQDLWPVEADKGQLSQVINNLIINAQQAMPDGGMISLSALNVQTAGQPFVKIMVRDEGSGIASENLDKIFDPYFTTKSGNSGLGLATAHSIITKHRGQIAVDSHLNQGTVFTIHLPARPYPGQISAPALTVETLATPLSSAHILVLDDEEGVREVLEAMLIYIGYQVTLTAAGPATIAAYQEAMRQGTPYQAVILDLTLPGGMGGQEVARQILALDPDARLLVSSGYADDPVMANYETYGFKARVEKPYFLATLRQTLQAVLA